MEVQGMRLQQASRYQRLGLHPWDAAKAERLKQNLIPTLRMILDDCGLFTKVEADLVRVGALGGMMLAVPRILKRMTTATEEADRPWISAAPHQKDEDI